MMMMDYSSQYAASSFGSDTLSGSMGSGRPPRIRTVRMVRPNHGTLPLPGLTCRHGPSLGFSVRGGREHGTGFFVSHVEPASEAHRQGLKVGDQIVRVNGFTVEDAIHKEVLQLISNHTHLTLKVRSVGMIPVKDKKTDPLSWQIITDYNSSTRSSPQLSEKIQDVRINIMVAPRTKLGCGICKGPEWKPGIFVQFTKEGGIAREAGLRPGDQILYCNNVDFSDIPFNEAVNLMKGARQLDLIVRKGAGSELFPGESSGYNSSASSVTGDQSPSWSESKRLSIVKEESLDLEDRLSQLDRFKTKKWEKIEWDDDRDEKPASYQFKPTIINLSDTNTSMIKINSSEECQNEEPTKASGCNTLGRNKSNKIADICLVSHQHETKTVVVEVHRSDEKEKTVLAKSPSINSFNSVTSRNSITSSTLSSAICEEIQRRAARNKKTPATETTSPPPSIDEQLQMKKILKGVDSEKQQQHNQLMNEFRKAHRKMFKGAEDREEDEVGNAPEKASNNETSQGRNSPRTESVVQQTINERLSSLNTNQREASQEKSSTPISRKGSNASVLSPPPPPPLPIDEVDEVDSPKSTTQPKQKVKAPPPPVPTKVVPSNQPPPCPTPDYDTLSISSTSTLPKKSPVNGFLKKELNKSLSHNGFGTSPEAESLQKSPKFNQQDGITPKNQNGYFKPRNSSASPNSQNGIVANGTLTKQRPVSVIIGEYPSGTSRKQPKKLDFLNGSRENAIRGGSNSDSISSQFASELAQTLNRSNLRKKTESMENLLNHPQIKANSNGSVRISVNNGGNLLGRHLAKSTNDLTSLDAFATTSYTSKSSKTVSNRVSITIPSHEKKTCELATPGGILKHHHSHHQHHNGGEHSAIGGVSPSSHRSMFQHQKTITFGDIPTVINDKPLHVT